jgi:UDP-N-acetylmuramoylalanine--D-glutamate ligase
MEQLEDKNVLVVGLARSGLAVAEFLASKGSRVTATDSSPAEELGTAVDAAKALGCSLELGGHPVDVFKTADLIVVSPGVPLDLPQLVAAGSMGVPIIGELELASRYVQLPIVAISGTNGKTTTTALVGDMLERSGQHVFVGGNIGKPLISVALSSAALEVAVVEVSSFQLDSMETFHPQVAVLLNISEDHLDRYDSFADYVASKCRLFHNQTEQDTAVIRAQDSLISRRCTIPSRILQFDRMMFSANTHLINGDLVCREATSQPHTYDLRRWQLEGTHNQENLLAAVLAATCMGARPEAIQESIDNFKPLPHRFELIRQWRGVRFVNDSKATNVDSVMRSLESLTSPIILIAGGREKEGSYEPLTALVRKQVKMLVLMGEARFRLAKVLGHLTHTVVVEEMSAATKAAVDAAVPGDVVLLSPACSSFDQYANYEARGDHFRFLVQSLSGAIREDVENTNNPWLATGRRK